MILTRSLAQTSMALCLLLISFFAIAAEETNETDVPGQIIASVTKTLLNTVREKGSMLDSDPDTYFKEVRGQLEPVIDFESIAKIVMGKKSWMSVEAEDQARFVDVFTESLVRTYGKAMASFVDLDIEVVKTWPSDNTAKKNYYVQQDVKLEGGMAHIVYNMYPVADGWQVRNVVIRDSKGYQLNMGKTFYKQFQFALKEQNGSVVAVIDNWGKE